MLSLLMVCSLSQALACSANVAEFNLQSEGEKAYSTFGAAAEHKALKMIMTT